MGALGPCQAEGPDPEREDPVGPAGAVLVPGEGLRPTARVVLAEGPDQAGRPYNCLAAASGAALDPETHREDRLENALEEVVLLGKTGGVRGVQNRFAQQVRTVGGVPGGRNPG